FPIGDQNVEGGSKPFVTYSLLLANILLFYYHFTLPPDAFESFFFQYGAVPADILEGKNLFSLFSSIFLHGGIAHLLGNMLFLWVFADNIEAVAGHWRFLFSYLAGGPAAGLFHVIFNPGSTIPSIRARGAVCAVFGTLFIFFPGIQVSVLIIFLLLP